MTLERVFALLGMAAQLLGSVRRAPQIAYCREFATRRWIARLDGYEAIADTRPAAAQRVLWLRARGQQQRGGD